MISGRKDTVVVHWAFAGSSKEPRNCTEAVSAKQAEPAISPAQGGPSSVMDLDERLDGFCSLVVQSPIADSLEAQK